MAVEQLYTPRMASYGSGAAALLGSSSNSGVHVLSPGQLLSPGSVSSMIPLLDGVFREHGYFGPGGWYRDVSYETVTMSSPNSSGELSIINVTREICDKWGKQRGSLSFCMATNHILLMIF